MHMNKTKQVNIEKNASEGKELTGLLKYPDGWMYGCMGL